MYGGVLSKKHSEVTEYDARARIVVCEYRSTFEPDCVQEIEAV